MKRYKTLTPPNHGNKGTFDRIAKAKKMVEYERLAKERGVPVARVIAEDIA